MPEKIEDGLETITNKAVSDKIEDRLEKITNKLTKKETKEKSEKLFYKGAKLSEKGLQKESIEYYDKAIEINPDDDSSWYNKGIMLFELGELKEAINAFGKAITINPENAKAQKNKGIVEEVLEMRTMSAALDKATEYNKAKLIRDLQDIYKKTEIHNNGLEIILKAAVADNIKYRPDATAIPLLEQTFSVEEAEKIAEEAYDVIGKRIFTKELSLSEKLYEEINKIKNDYGNSLVDSKTESSIGMSKNSLKKEFVKYKDNLFDSIEKIVDKATVKKVKKLTKKEEEGLFRSVDEPYNNKDYEGAIRIIDNILLRNSNSSRAWIQKGSITYQLGDKESAAKYYKIATIIDPTNRHAHLSLGNTLKELEINDKEADKSLIIGHGMDKI